jgi:hypothetical protein
MENNRPFILRAMISDVYPFSSTDEELRAAQSSLGLVPSSPDGVKIEREQSNDRMKATGPIADLLSFMCLYAAEAVTQRMVDNVEDPEAPKETIKQMMVPQNAQVIGIGTQSVIAQLLEAGVLEFKKEQ